MPEGAALFGPHSHPEVSMHTYPLAEYMHHIDRINPIIFDELVQGQTRDESRGFFQGVTEKLATRGCDAVVLACTEIPLLVTQTDSTLPVVDSTRTLARAALREAAGNKC